MGKRILITGKDSYIGDSFCAYTTEYGNSACELDVRTDDYKNHNFSQYDTVVHVAAIVHKKAKEFSKEDYYKVNAQLAFDIAKKAKESGVKHFIFLSSMSVYGLTCGEITRDTKLSPSNLYAQSKLEGERLISTLESKDFTITVLRPPLVYGKGCKGNYTLLSDFAKKFPIFPDYKSQRSMIYITNLCRFIQVVIDKRMSGVFCPQDESYVCVSNMVEKIKKANGKKAVLTKVFNPFISLLIKLRVSKICKVFGTLTYSHDMCEPFDRISFEQAIELTEK